MMHYYILDCTDRILYDYSRYDDMTLSDIALEVVGFEQIDFIEADKCNEYMILDDTNVDYYAFAYISIIYA